MIPGKYTRQCLEQENVRMRGTGGTSAENRGAGFLPAFIDQATGRIYHSTTRDGRPAPIHLLDGLPGDIVTERDATGRVRAVKASVVAGFLLSGRFYTREQAAEYLQLRQQVSA